MVSISRESEINHSRDFKGVHPNSNSFFVTNREKQGFTQGHSALEFTAKATHRKAKETVYHDTVQMHNDIDYYQ